MNNESKLHEVALNRIEGIGPATFVRLVEAFESAEKVFHTSADDLVQKTGLRPTVAKAVADFDEWTDVEAELAQLDKKSIRLLSCRDSAYPTALKQISGFPPVLYVWGRTDVLNRGDGLGVVGARLMSNYGARACRQIALEMASRGVTIVSGFAKGIDITAHLAAIDAHGLTIGVLGSGLGSLYPPDHRRHISRMIESGCLVSEFPFSVEPRPEFFPRRNRIISGLSRGILVVEAGEKSGALITAQYAVEQNRDVFVLPGSVFSEKSAGCHRLIRQGARLVTGAEDILAEWSYPVSVVRIDAFANEEERLIYQACAGGVFSADEIVEKTGLPASQAGILLTKLEMEGKIRGHPGKRYESV